MPTFYDHFCRCAEQWPQNVALEIQTREGTESYTYAQARQMAESVGRWLQDNLSGPEIRCAILADNHPRWATTYLGVIAAGHVVVPLDTALHADQVSKLLEDSETALVFCDGKNLHLVQKAIGTRPIQIVLTHTPGAGTSDCTQPTNARVVTDLETIFANAAHEFVPAAPDEDGLAAILYTSGTTANPKGVMLTHRNLLGEVNSVFGLLHLGPEDALLGVLPLFHVLSQMASLLLPLVKGSRVVYLETLNTTELTRALGERNITAFAIVPQFFYLVHERIFKEVEKRGVLAQFVVRALMTFNRGLRGVGINAGRTFFGPIHKTFGTRMRYMVTGGSRFNPAIGHDFYALGIDVLQVYGLTEVSGGAFLTDPANNVIGSVGRPLPGVEAKIVDLQPTEDGGPPTGEICIRGALVMKGYWKRPDATDAVLQDGWLHTGDLGYSDQNGNFFITGRSKEVIVLSNGKNIYPEEVEAHYLKSPAIQELCVLGREGKRGDPQSERLHAVVVPNFEVLRQRKVVNVKEVIRFDIEGLSAQMPSTKRIGSYEIWQEALPRTTTRKLKRFEIERRVKATPDAGRPEVDIRPLTSEEETWSQQPEVAKALAVIRDAAKNNLPQIIPSHSLELDLGLDSMQRVELLVELEKAIGGDVDESRLGDIYTVRQLVDAVRESVARGGGRAQAQFVGWEAVLNETPTDKETLELLKDRPAVEVTWFFITRIVQMFVRDLFHLRVSGLENLPAHGPFLLCSNHQSYLDAVVLVGLLPWRTFRNIFSIGTSEIFGTGFMRALARMLRLVVVDPDANLVPAMRASAFGLRNGRVLVLYPEGERCLDGAPAIFKKGAAVLSIHMQVPIVPIAIDGFYEAWPRGKPFFQKFTNMKMDIGRPILPPPKSAASEDAYEKFTAQLKAEVVRMWKDLRDLPK